MSDILLIYCGIASYGNNDRFQYFSGCALLVSLKAMNFHQKVLKSAGPTLSTVNSVIVSVRPHTLDWTQPIASLVPSCCETEEAVPVHRVSFSGS